MKRTTILICFLFVAGILKSYAQYTDMLNFNGASSPQGQSPNGSLAHSINKLYGMTYTGGTHGQGNVFSVDTNGSGYIDLLDFSGTNGNEPFASLLILQNRMYGTTRNGGAHNYGCLFYIDTNGTGYKDIYDFTNLGGGANPFGNVILVGNKFYGMTLSGGIHSEGNIFSIDTNGAGYTDLFDFNGTNGKAPYGSLVFSGGKLFGMTLNGGVNVLGNVFSVDTNGHNFKDLYDFSLSWTTGLEPIGSLIIAGNRLYGMAYNCGGALYDGSVFAIDTDGTAFTVLHDFGKAPNGANPQGSLLRRGKVLYGMTSTGGINHYGNVFAIDTDGSAYFDLYDFNNTKGGYPYGDLISSGKLLYGMTPNGGTTNNGVVFSLCPVGVALTTLSNVTCYGGNDGSALASVDSNIATGPYTYSWAATGGSTNTASGLTAGIYTVTVTNNNGCTQSASVTITQPPLLTATMGTVKNVSCFGGNNGSANVIAGGGTVAYTYSWAPNGGSGATGTALTAGSYTVTVIDNHGCITTDSVIITQPPVLTAAMGTITNVSCFGGNNGHANVIAGGGTPAYTYLWHPSGGTNATGTGFVAGNYTVTITDHNGCVVTDSATITQPPQLTATMGAVTNDVCFGGNTGSANVIAGGGTPAYTYSWAPNGGLNAMAAGLTAGTYTLTLTDNNNCNVTASATITQPNAVSVLANTTANVSCRGGNNGSALSIVSGGTSPYTYSWSGGGTNATATGLSAGTYTVTVQDSCNNTSTASITVTQPGVLIATANVTANVSCAKNNGIASVSLSGGSAPYTYSWSDVNAQTTSTASGLSVGTYTVTVQDSCNNTVTASVTITQPGTLNATAGITTNVSCDGGNNGSATVNLSGGSAPYTYSWSDINAQTTSAATGLSAGTYTITVHDVCDSTSTAFATITQPGVLTASASITANVSCHGGNNGSASSIVSGGTSPYTYSWSSGKGTNTTATLLSAGSYTLTVKDNNGCSITSGITITQPNALSVSANITANVSCRGGNTGSASSIVSGGTSPYTYSWSGGGTNATATALFAGSYTITVHDACSNTSTASVTITQPGVLSANSAVTSNASCNGGNNGSARCNPSGGTTPYTYLWSDVNAQTTSVATGLSAGTYTLTVHDACGNVSTGVVTIAQPGVLNATAYVLANLGCHGTDTGSARTSASGGTPPYTYSWSGGRGANTTATGLSAGSYSITVTDLCGGAATASVTITQPTQLTATPYSASATSGCTGVAAVIPGGGTVVYTYIWSPGGQITDTITNQCAGVYTCTVRDANGCSVTASVNINNCTNTFNEPICIVTIDTANNKSRIIWGRTDSPPADGYGSYNVYKYNGTSYVLINTQPLDSLSEFTDLTSDPSVAAQSYELSTTDSCGESALSPPHTSILLTTYASTNAYNLSWTPYIGFTPVRYRIFRGLSMSDLVQIDSVSNTVFTYRDTLPPLNVYYALEAVNPSTTPCTPTTHPSTAFSSGSFSNGFNTAILGVNNIHNVAITVKVYPNPNNGQLTVQSSTFIDKAMVEIYNMLGEEVYAAKLNSTNTQIDMSDDASGVYLYRIFTETGTPISTGKFVIQK